MAHAWLHHSEALAEIRRKQYCRAHKLAYARRYCRARGAQPERVYKQRVKANVQQSAYAYTYHGIFNLSLRAQKIVHHEGYHHERRGYQYIIRIRLCMRQHRFRCAKEPHERIKEYKPRAQYYKPEGNRQKQRCACNAVCVGVILFAKAAGNKAACALPYGETHGLDYIHKREHNAHRAGCAGAKLAYEISIGAVIYAGYQHAYHRGYAHG